MITKSSKVEAINKKSKKKRRKDYKMRNYYFLPLCLCFNWSGSVKYFSLFGNQGPHAAYSCLKIIALREKNWTWIQTKNSTTKQGSSSPQLYTNFTHKLSDVVLKSTNSALYQFSKNPQCQARYKRNLWKILSRI